MLPPEHVDIAIVLASLGDVMLAQREFEAALRYYEEVRTLAKGTDLRTRHELTRARIGIGAAQLELGHPQLAREPLEAALADPEAEDSDPIARCELRLGLARVLAESGADRSRAQTLAREAQALCREDEARAKPYLTQLAALTGDTPSDR